MRILVVSNLYPPIVEGGYEARCAVTSERLREQHDVHVLTSTRRRQECPPDPLVRRELPILPAGRLSIPLAPLAAMKGMKVMRRTLAEFQPDLIFVWNGTRIPHAALQTAHDSGIPVAYSVGEHWFGRLYSGDPLMRYLMPGQSGLRGVWGRLARAVNRLPALRTDPLRRARAAICWNSEATRRVSGIPPMLVPTHEATIYPGVSEPERWTRLERRPAGTATVAYVGRVESEKGPDVAYRALARLRDAHGIDARLLLAGPVEPEMSTELERLARELRIEGSVELLGRLDKSEVGRMLETAHVLVAPSTWDEPFGLVLLEAALARVPVVAARSGGMPEALREGSEALFFPMEDDAGCADMLARALTDTAGTQARVEAAFARAEELSFERYIAEMARFVVDARASFERDGAPLDSPVEAA